MKIPAQELVAFNDIQQHLISIGCHAAGDAEALCIVVATAIDAEAREASLRIPALIDFDSGRLWPWPRNVVENGLHWPTVKTAVASMVNGLNSISAWPLLGSNQHRTDTHWTIFDRSRLTFVRCGSHLSQRWASCAM